MADKTPKPSVLLSMMELRAPLEIISLLSAFPLLTKIAPRGKDQPVLVIPGFMTGDNSTLLLRRFLNAQGFRAFPWKMGRNPGLQLRYYKGLEKRVLALQDAYGKKVSVVGWSLGGLYARVLGHKLPNAVRQVITLGTPFNFAHSPNQDVAVPSAIVKLYQRLNPSIEQDELVSGSPIWEQAPPVPSTSIYSETDGVASWRYCIDRIGKQTENLCISGSHIGMTHNPVIMYTIAERLAQREGRWAPFHAKRAHRLFFTKASYRTKAWA